MDMHMGMDMVICITHSQYPAAARSTQNEAQQKRKHQTYKGDTQPLPISREISLAGKSSHFCGFGLYSARRLM